MNNSALGFAYRLSLNYGAIFAILGIYLPFMPIWLSYRGMGPAEIGIITSAPLFIRVLAAPSIAIWSDRQGDHRATIILGSWCASACAVALFFAHGFWPIFLLVIVFQVSTQSVLPLLETKALAGARRHDLDYGRMRLWGSVAFIAANLLGGVVISHYGSASVIAMVTVAIASTALAAHILPREPQDLRGEEVAPNRRAGLTGLWQLLRQPWFIVTMLAAGLIQGSHAVYYAFSAIHWRSLGIGDGWIGILWALGVAAEIALFAVSRRALQRLGAIGMILIGGGAGVVRWVAMALDPAFWLLFPLQTLHALTFGATYLGALNLIQTEVDASQSGTAQSIHAALSAGIIMGGMTLMAGFAYAELSETSFFIMAGAATSGCLAALVLRRLVASR